MSFAEKGIVLCVLILAVSAYVSENLKVAAFELGEIWVTSVEKAHIKLHDFMSGFTDIYSYKFYILLVLGSILGYYIYDFFFTSLNRVRLLGDIGYLPDGKFSMKDIANDVKRRRLVGEVPPVYPNGWFGLMEGSKLKRGEAKSISVLGKFWRRFPGVLASVSECYQMAPSIK